MLLKPNFINRLALGMIKWLIYSGTFLLLTIVIVLIFFSWQADRREKLSPIEGAPTSGRLVQAYDIRIFIQEDGPEFGPAVLLVHGTGAWSEIWRETIDVLAQNGFHVIAMDVPPFGYSEKPQGVRKYSREQQARRIIRLLETLGLQNVTLIGHSVGSRPVIEAAMEAPDKISNLVLVDPALGFAKRSKEFQQNQPSRLIKIFFNFTMLRNAVLAAFATNPSFTRKIFSSFVSNTDAVTEERIVMLQQPYVIKNITNAYGDWLQYLVVEQDTSLTNNFENFNKLKMPVYIIWGSTDNVTPLWQGERLQQLIPKSRLSIIQNAGHIPYIENPEQFNKLLLGYLQEKKSAVF